MFWLGVAQVGASSTGPQHLWEKVDFVVGAMWSYKGCWVGGRWWAPLASMKQRLGTCVTGVQFSLIKKTDLSLLVPGVKATGLHLVMASCWQRQHRCGHTMGESNIFTKGETADKWWNSIFPGCLRKASGWDDGKDMCWMCSLVKEQSGRHSTQQDARRQSVSLVCAVLFCAAFSSLCSSAPHETQAYTFPVSDGCLAC